MNLHGHLLNSFTEIDLNKKAKPREADVVTGRNLL